MAKILKGEGGCSFLSDSGLTYSILKGVTLGGAKQLESDMFFVMGDNPDFNLDWNDYIVSWYFGASDFEENPDNYLDQIVAGVTAWEKKHHLFRGPEIYSTGGGVYQVDIPLGGGRVFMMDTDDIEGRWFNIFSDGSGDDLIDWETIFNDENLVHSFKGGDDYLDMYSEDIQNAWKMAVALFKAKGLWK